MIKPLIALATLALLSGCISFGEKPPKSLLTLTSASMIAPGQTMTAKPGQTITVLVPTVPQSLATTRVPVQATTTSIAYVKDASWVEPPNRLFQRLLSDVIEAKTGRAVLSPRQFTFDPGLRVSGQLVNFGIDAASSSAVVTFDAAISRVADQVETRRFEARVPVSAIEAGAVGVALNEAANQVAAEVAGWVGT